MLEVLGIIFLVLVLLPAAIGLVGGIVKLIIDEVL